jgi:hypothetical protein
MQRSALSAALLVRQILPSSRKRVKAGQRLVWNRQHYIKDPTTRRRVARLNPEKSWIVQTVPNLRIVGDDLWHRVKQRQEESRDLVSRSGLAVRPEQARRPVYLLSGLLKCGACGGGFSKVSEKHYGCSNARNRGTCDNRLTIRREVIEASVLSGLRTHLMHPDLVREFVAETIGRSTGPPPSVRPRRRDAETSSPGSNARSGRSSRRSRKACARRR